jgi:hypothetical protein
MLSVMLACPAAVAQPSPADGGPGWWFVNPKITFFRTANDAKALPPTFFILAELPFADPAKPLTIEVFGDYRPNLATGDTRNVLHGVFTKTTTCLAANLQKRLPDALNAGAPVITGPTYHGSLPTDIIEDFRIVPDSTGKFRIKIPAGAVWVSLCVADSYYSDNDDPDCDFYVRFSRQ